MIGFVGLVSKKPEAEDIKVKDPVATSREYELISESPTEKTNFPSGEIVATPPWFRPPI
jgi:hypothetical protein